jgi:hypothetical protein
MSKFKEELLNKKLKKLEGPVRDYSNPKLAGFLSETDVTKYQDTVLDLNIECWYDLIEPCTFKTVFCPISLADAKLFVQVYEKVFKDKPNACQDEMMSLLEPEQIEQLEALKLRVNNEIKALKTG